MKLQQFFQHHGLSENPFAQEDAQADYVFQRFCLDATKHPAWDKIYSHPENPATSVVFGEKGSGKTALRLQIAEELKEFNRTHPEGRVFVIEYDDFNPFLDSFRERLSGRQRKPERTLQHWRLWDHMDAILSIGVTRLVDAILAADGRQRPDVPVVARDRIGRLSRPEKRDLLLLAAFYDHARDVAERQRWKALRRKLKFSTWQAGWDWALGLLVTAATIALVWYFAGVQTLGAWWPWTIIAVSWLPWLTRQLSLLWTSWQVSRQIRVFDHLPNTLRNVLSHFRRQDTAGQPVPSKDRSDDRYELLMKLQSVLRTLGFSSTIVLMDRVDEPHLINGSPERMRDLLWPMFDNKFLKHPGLGFKMLLPAEVLYYINREEKHFYERSRLDKQNLVPSLQWTGESLYDIANDRIRACAADMDKAPSIRDFFDESIGKDELIGIFGRLRVPRHLFKFLHRLLVDHCSRYTEEHPAWTINRETLQASLALQLRDLEAFDRGLGTG